MKKLDLAQANKANADQVRKKMLRVLMMFSLFVSVASGNQTDQALSGKYGENIIILLILFLCNNQSELNQNRHIIDNKVV